jgi:hypothetical protein
MKKNDNAQLYTFEAISVAFMMLLVIIFVIKASPLTPLTSSASNQRIEAQLETQGMDLLIILDYASSGYSPLKNAIMYWRGNEFNGQTSVYPASVNYISSVLYNAFGVEGIAYNLEVCAYDPAGNIVTHKMFWNGLPSDNAVIVSRKIVLHNDDVSGNTELREKIKDVDTATDFYNILDLRLTLWRM